MRCFAIDSKTRLFQFEEDSSEQLTQLFVACTAEIEQWSGVIDVHFSYTEILVEWVGADYALKHEQSILELFEGLKFSKPRSIIHSPKLHNIDVIYDGQDLSTVAQRLKLSVDEVVALHSQTRYHVFALGFQPGFAFLGHLDKRLQLPRKEVPLQKVPAGSLAIAADQTAIYPHASPGGWHLIGNVLEPVFEVGHPLLTRFAPGDRVQFNPR